MNQIDLITGVKKKTEKAKPKNRKARVAADRKSTEVARVSAQWGFSLQVGEGEWQMLRISIEVPCTLADLQATKERVIADVIAESDMQKKALVARLGQAYFGERKKSPLDDLMQ